MLGCLPRLYTPQLSGNKMLGSRDGFSFMYVALSGFLINLRTLVWQKTNAICLLKSVRERIKVLFLVFLFTNKGSGSHVACARHKSISTQSTQQWTPGIGTQASDKFLTQPIPSTLKYLEGFVFIYTTGTTLNCCRHCTIPTTQSINS